MKLRRPRGEVKESESEMAVRGEEVEEDDDNATLQDCLDRQKMVTSRPPKRVALTPLDDEDIVGRGRKKVKEMRELLATDSVRVGETPCSDNDSPKKSAPPIDGVVDGNNSLEGGKKRRGKKKRRRNVDVGRVNDENVHDSELDNAPLSKEEVIIILITKEEELAEEFPRGFGSPDQSGPGTAEAHHSDPGSLGAAESRRGSCDGNPVGPGTPEVLECNMHLTEEIFLPVDGYHTCGDAESCHIACLKKVLDHLDKMSEEQLKLWYKAIIGEVFASRSGEKVRGRLRRMIRCKVKEAIKSQASSTVRTHSSSSSLATQPCDPLFSLEPVIVSDPLLESPGSKLSTSNTDERSVEAEDAVCSGETFSEKPPVSYSSDLSTGLTSQLPSESPSTNEASANSSVDDPETAVPAVQFLVTARITRSKARVIEKSAVDIGPDVQTSPEVCSPSVGKNSITATEESEVPLPIPTVSPSDELADRDVQTPPVEVAAERRTRSRKNFAAEKASGEVTSSNAASKGRLSRVKPARGAEEPKQTVLVSCQVGESVEGAPSLSDAVRKHRSDSMDKSGLSEITSLEGQVTSVSVSRQREGEALLTTSEVTKVEESLNSRAVFGGSPSAAVAETACEKAIDGMDEVTFEGRQMIKPLESQGDSAMEVCKDDGVTEKEDRVAGSVVVSNVATSMTLRSMARAQRQEASSSGEFDESSEVCSVKSSVAVTSCGVDEMEIHAPVNQDTECDEEEIEFQKVFVAEAPKPHSIMSNTPVLYPPSSSTSVLETVCALNTECQDFLDEDNIEGSTEFFERISFLAADCASAVQSFFSIPSEDPVQLVAELSSDEELHGQLDLEHCCAEGEEVALESGCEQVFEQVWSEKTSSVEVAFGTGSYQFFEQLCADKVSCLWPTEGEEESTSSTMKRLGNDSAESNMVTEFGTASISGKWQLLKCESGRSDEGAEAAEPAEIAPLPNVWRDAGEFLEDLDNLYMMVDPERRPSSSSLRKRKYHDCDVADDCGKPSDFATSCTRQRVELISEKGSFVATEELSPEADDFEYFGGTEQSEERSNPSTSLDCETTMDAETSAVSEEVEDPLSSQYHQELRMDEGRNEGSNLEDKAPTKKEVVLQEESSEPSLKAKFRLSPAPSLGDSFPVEPPLCDSPASTSEEEGSPEPVVKSDACIDLLACERLVQEDDPKDYQQSSDLLATRKIESLREADSDESPPPSLPPIRLKLPSGRARLLASALSESKMKFTRDWRYPDARDLDQKPRAATDFSLSPNSSDEDTGEQESMFESAPAEGRSSQEQSLVLSPPSSQPRNSGDSQENDASPESHVPPPSTARCSKGILKTTSKCKDCVELRFQSRTALDFVASQMKTFGEVAGRLTKEIQELRSILETEVSGAEGVMQDKFKAISRSRDIERSAEKNLTLLLRDCKRFCKLAGKRPRKIVFADEAGKKLCHVKTFQAPPALARPLWDIM